jgi:Na+/H+ antiporter NhaA
LKVFLLTLAIFDDLAAIVFIAGLAFEHGGGEYFAGDRLGVLLGSVLSAVIAYIILHFCLPKTATSGH